MTTNQKHLPLRPWKANETREALTILRSGTAERSETAEGRESVNHRSLSQYFVAASIEATKEKRKL